MLTSRVSRLTISQTLAIVEKVRTLQKQGLTIYDLSVGEPDHPSPAEVKQAGHQAIDDNFTKYTAAAGIFELEEAMVEKPLATTIWITPPSKLLSATVQSIFWRALCWRWLSRAIR